MTLEGGSTGTYSSQPRCSCCRIFPSLIVANALAGIPRMAAGISSAT